MSQRTYHDPLHRGIGLDRNAPAEAMVMELVDTAPFQRLRRIRQLGPAFLTFHSAESSRFTHSLGVFHLARRAFNRMLTLDPALEQHRGLLYAAALLHDIGHGPMSHTGEEMFGLHHEAWSARVIREHPAIRASLDNHEEGTAEAVADLLERGTTPHPLIKRRSTSCAAFSWTGMAFSAGSKSSGYAVALWFSTMRRLTSASSCTTPQ